MLRPIDPYEIDMRKPEHRALVLRTYLSLIREGIPPDAAQIKAAHQARELWRAGKDYPYNHTARR